MALVNYTSRAFGIRILRESTFGTASSLSSGSWLTLVPEAMPKMEGDVSHDDLMLTDTNRIKDTADLYTNTINSNASMAFSTPWRRETAHALLGMAFQTASPGNTGADPYVHTWTIHPTQPDFSANAGFFYSVIADSADTDEAHLMKSAILSNLSITGNPTGKGKAGLVYLNGTFWSPFERSVGQSYTATPSTPSTNFLNASMFYATIAGGNNLPVRSFSIDIATNPYKIPTGGTAATIGYNIPFHSAKLKMEVFYNDDTDGLFGGLQAGTGYAIVLTNGVATSSYESFTATMYGRIINEPLEDSNGNAVMNFEFELLSNSGTAPISLVMTDAKNGL